MEAILQQGYNNALVEVNMSALLS